MKTNIINVQRFCTKDGPGIRTTVFFKGCPLRCLWCHNPESQSAKREVMYDAKKCTHCLRCVSGCPSGCHTQDAERHVFDRTACTACGACLSLTCDALEVAGTELDTGAIMDEVLKDRLYYENSGGGITLSGGEPLIHTDDALALLKASKTHGIHTCVETCGFVSREQLQKTMPWIDLYLFDWKESDPQKHLEYTGVDNCLILENLRYIDAKGKQTVLRCPIIPTVNDRNDHLEGIARCANSLKHLVEIVVEPYHTLGVGKYERLDRDYTLAKLSSLDAKATDITVTKLQKLTSVPVKKA